MGTQYEKFKQKANAKAKQNRVNRVTKKANKYNDGKLNKTHKTYIAGDVKSSASTRAFGYKKYGMQGDSYITEKGRSKSNQAKINRGENPYELKYIYDGVSRKVDGGTRADGSKYDSFTSKKRFLTDDEKKAWKATGSTNVKEYDRTHKYSILRGYDSDGKTFKSNLNFRDNKGKIKWDGMEVAKNKVKNGGSKLNYIGGFLKDTVIDPGVDLMKRFDYVESGLMGGALGAFETVKDVSNALTSKNKKLSDVNYKRAVDNFKESTKESNKTGWGKSAVDYFKDWSKRSDEERYQEILKTKGKKSADEFKKSTEKLKPFTDTVSTVVGFGADLLNPFEVGSALTKTTKKLAGDSIDLAKNIKKGTADISLGFTPDKGKTQEMINKYSKRYKNSSKPKESTVLDTLTAGSREINDVNFNSNKKGRFLRDTLDKGFDNAMAKKEVNKVIKSNPNTPNLSNFLDNLNNKPIKGKQLSIDGRTLNKKYTQLASGESPQLMRNGEQIVEELGTIDNNQLSMFNRNGNTNTYEKNIKLSNNRFEKMYNAYKDEDMLFEMIDDLSDSNADGMLDWLQKNKPDVYKRYMGDIDDVDNLIDKDVALRNYNDTINERVANQKQHDYFISETVREYNPYINKYFDPEEVIPRTTKKFKGKASDVKKYVATEQAKLAHNDNNVIRNAYNKMNIDRIMNKLETPKIADEIKDINKRKKAFASGGKDFSRNLDKLSNQELSELQNAIRYFDDMKLDSYDKRDLAVDMLNKMMFNGQNIIRRNIPVDKLKNLLTYFDDLAESKIALKNGEFSFKPKGEYNTSKKGIHYFTGKNGNPNPFDNKFNFFAPTSVDDVFEEKMKGIGKKLGVSNKVEQLDVPFEILTDKIKSGEKLTKDEVVQYKELKHKLDVWNEHWQNVKNMGYDDYDKYYNENLFKKPKDVDLSDVHKNSLKLSSESDFIAFDEPDELAKIERQFRNKYQSNQYENSIDALFEKRPYETQVSKGDYYGGILDEADYQRMKYEESHAIDVIGDLGLKFVNYDKINLPKGKKLNYREMTRHKEVKKALVNIRKLTDKMLGTPVEMETTHKILRTEMRRISDSLKKAGVDNDVWLDELTKYKNSKLKSVKTKAESPLELAGINIKSSKKYNDGVLSPLEREFKNLKSQGAKTWDELYSDDYYKSVFDDKYLTKEGTFKDKALRGDSVGDTITQTPLDKLRRKGSGSRASRLEPWQTLNDAPRNSIKNMSKRSKRYVDNAKVPEKAMDYDAFVDESNDLLSDFWSKHSNNTNAKELTPLERVLKDDNYNPFDEIEQINSKSVNDKLDEPIQSIDDFVQERLENVKPQTPVDKALDFPEDKFNENIGNKKDGKNFYEDSKAFDLYKRWLNSWKKGLTVYNPGWHVQNFFQNKGQNYLALGTDAFGSQKEARQHLKNIQGLENKAGNIVNKKTGEIYSPQDIKRLALQYDVVEGLGQDVQKARGVFSNLETKVDNSKLMKKLGNSEQTARLYHFLTKIERGATPEQASKSVNKYLYDYSKKSKLDKGISDFVDPFWTFHKNNARMLTQAMYENPSGSANILRANRGLDSSLRGEGESNSKYREHQAPFASFKDGINGDTYDYQYDETVLPDVQDAIPLEKDDLLNKLNPFLNIAYKQSQGVGNFDKKVVDGEAGWNEITKDERKAEIAKDLNPFMNPLVKAYYKAKDHQEKADKGKQSQETSDKQILMDWIAYITGNKGNYYRDWK